MRDKNTDIPLIQHWIPAFRKKIYDSFCIKQIFHYKYNWADFKMVLLQCETFCSHTLHIFDTQGLTERIELNCFLWGMARVVWFFQSWRNSIMHSVSFLDTFMLIVYNMKQNYFVLVSIFNEIKSLVLDRILPLPPPSNFHCKIPHHSISVL